MFTMSAAPAIPTLPFPAPPPWLLHEVQQRIVLLLNHVLQAEPQAVERLLRQKGKIALMECSPIAMKFIVTKAGLLDLAGAESEPHLTVKVLDSQPLQLLQTFLRGDKPPMEISGDVMLAAEVNWLVDHVRWDIEEDLSRIVGDVPAHTMMQAVRGLGAALKQFLVPAHTATSQDKAAQP